MYLSTVYLFVAKTDLVKDDVQFALVVPIPLVILFLSNKKKHNLRNVFLNNYKK